MPTGTPPAQDWMDRFFSSYYEKRPVNATFIGLHDWDHKLPDFSEDGAGDTLAEMDGLLDESEPLWTASEPGAEASAPRASDMESLDRRMAEGFLRIQRWEYQSRHLHRGNPSLYTGEAVFGLLSLFLTDYAPLADRMAAATERMLAIPGFLAQGRENVRSAPPAWTARAIRECHGALAFLTGGIDLLLTPSMDDPQGPATGMPPTVSASFRSAAVKAAVAFQDFQKYLELELLRKPTEEYACGEEALSLYLREGHFLDASSDEVAEYAGAQLREASARLEEHPEFTPESLSRLQDFHPTVDQYYLQYQEVWDSVRSISEDESLLTWPDFPIRYVPRPAWSREAAPHLYFLFYRSPAAFNRPPVHDYLVTPIDSDLPAGEQDELLRANNDSVIKLNHVIHHGSIGHHVQNWHAFRSPSRIGRMAAVDCASRIAMFCGGTMAEGWACYATDLMREAGALTPLEEYAEQRGRTRMCARTIVDVRLHQGRMTLDEATAFYREQAGMGEAAARGEAVKNSMFPGAAVIYLMGTDGIHDLRKDISAKKGADFNLREFHDEFLSHGSIPVPLIAERMKRAPDPERPGGSC
jgi:hypothetical protein